MSKTFEQYRTLKNANGLAGAMRGGPPRNVNPWPAAASWLLQHAVPAALLVGYKHTEQLRRTLQHSRAGVHAIREQLNGIVSCTPVGVVQTDLNGRILLANEGFCGLVGHQTTHLRTLCLHDMTHPEDRDAHLEQLDKMLATGKPFRFENRLVGADEGHIWVIGHLALTCDPQGRPRHIVAAIQDISARRAAEAALLEMTATLEQRVAEAAAQRVAMQEEVWRAQRREALSQLAGGVAHDFNNVLQAIAGGARLIQRRPADPAAVQRLAGLMIDAVERGATITQRLSSFARRGLLQPSVVDTAGLLTELRDVLKGMLGGGIRIEVAVPSAVPALFADQAQLKTALVNLATNAGDAMAGGGDANGAQDLVLRLSATAADGMAAGLPPGRYVRIDVSDNGPGMDAAIIEHATEPFFTTKPRGRGTGLGLAMARGFAEQSGGRLTLHSTAMEGTTASLWLPQADLPAGERAGMVTGAGGQRRPSVVLVDDDAEVRGLLSELLASFGYSVAEFDSAAPALSHFNGSDPAQLLITDLSMPGADGLALIQEARRLRPGLPAILLTGRSREEVGLALEKVASGRVAVLQKPVRARELLMMVEAIAPGSALSA